MAEASENLRQNNEMQRLSKIISRIMLAGRLVIEAKTKDRGIPTSRKNFEVRNKNEGKRIVIQVKYTQGDDIIHYTIALVNASISHIISYTQNLTDGGKDSTVSVEEGDMSLEDILTEMERLLENQDHIAEEVLRTLQPDEEI